MRLCSLSLHRQRLQVLWLARLLGWVGSLCASLHMRILQPLQVLRFAASLHVRILQPLQVLRFARLLGRLDASLRVRPLLLPLRVALALLLPWRSCLLLLLEKKECSTLLPMQLQHMMLNLL